MTAIIPEKNEFLQNQGHATLVYQRVKIPNLTPIAASLCLQATHPYFSFLESVQDGTQEGRYSVIGLDPDLIWKCDKNKAYLSENGQAFKPLNDTVLASFRKLHQASLCEIPKGFPPMAAGLLGYMSYDAVRFFEDTVTDQNPDPIDIPLSIMMRPSVMVIFDKELDDVLISSAIWPSQLTNPEKAYDEVVSRLGSVYKELCQNKVPILEAERTINLDFRSNMTEAQFCEVVETCKAYIVAGDIYQVVPSQRFQSQFSEHPFAFYQALRELNPSPYLFYIHFGDFHLVGSSPEIMVRLQEGKVTIRPLAGTRPRGKTQEEDEALEEELKTDVKELSEHLMLLDLSRHDVARVCKPGSVRVTEYMVIEKYSHVMHISSNVEGEYDPQYDALDVLFSALPVGTVSGAPKIRAMQIIDELEPVKRGFYAGCVGYFSANGSMDTCITLRTALIKDQMITVQAGAGIVAESDPMTEYQETINKAKAIMRAAENAKSVT